MIRALLLISRWIGLAHDRLRAKVAGTRPLSAEVDVLHEELEKLRCENQLLRSRLDRVGPRNRPHYRPSERLEILWHADRYGLSRKDAADAFFLSIETIKNWSREARTGIHRLVRARAPINRISHLVEHVVYRLAYEWPNWGSRRIAGILVRLGLKGSRSTVQRVLRRGPRKPPHAATGSYRGRLRAKRPGHIWVVDFTHIRSRFRHVVVGAILDAFSRKILSIRAFRREPTAAHACSMLQSAIRTHGKPRWIISDRGGQFRSNRFKRLLKRRRIRRRFARVGEPNLSLIDRFWRSLKEEYADPMLAYLPIRPVDRRLRRYAHLFGRYRPHEGLELRTPDELFFRRSRRRRRNLQSGVFLVHFLEGDRRLPMFRLRPAA